MYRFLIDVDGLARIGSRVRLFDCRAVLGDPDAGRRAYDGGHIPGALHADLDRDMAGSPGSGGRHPLPDRSALAELVPGTVTAPLP